MIPIRFSGFHRSGLSLDFRLWRPDKPVQCKRSRIKQTANYANDSYQPFIYKG